MAKCQKDPTCGIFLKRGLFKGIKNDTPMCQTCKYTNTEIQHMTKRQKDPTCGVFLKRGLFKFFCLGHFEFPPVTRHLSPL